MVRELPSRRDVPGDLQWDVESVYPSLSSWEEAFGQVDRAIEDLAPFCGRLGESAAVLWEAMEALMATSRLASRVSLYAGMLRAGDAADQGAAALSARTTALRSRLSAQSAFYRPEILAIPEQTLREYYAIEARLETYRHHFDSLRLVQPHMRSAEVEEVLARTLILRSGPSQLYRSLVDADLQFAAAVPQSGEAMRVQQGSIGSLLDSPDRSLRKGAWESYADGHLSMKNTLASSLVQSFQGNVFGARVRGYKTVLESSLQPNAIPRSVFDNLIAAFERNLPIWHRYWALLRKALKVDTLRVYDSPITHGPRALAANARKVDWSDAVQMVCEGMAPLGEEYVGPMRLGLTKEKWVDAWPNQGKTSGAFSSGAPGSHPFIMMNFDEDIRSLGTLAHELGHSMHSYLAWKHQPQVYSGYSLFVAETASNFNQAMVRAHLLEPSADPEFRLQVLDEAFANFFRYLFVMPTLARFELDCYTKLEGGGALTADSMSARIVELFREGFGGEVEIDEPRLGITWAQFGHLYSCYYVFQYATGISAANALARQVLDQGKGAADRYLEFLKAGGSVYPLDALTAAGVDMTTTAPVEAGFAALSGLVDELEAIVG